MAAAPLTIAVGGVFHETHAFSPRRTGMADFRWSEGTALLEEARGAGTTLGGILHEIEVRGHHAVPLAFAAAAPGGPVEEDVVDRLRNDIAAGLRAAGPVDAVALELHGAMATETDSDVEGSLLAWLREQIGGAPVAAGLDLHAHLTPRMLGATDILTACRENPHRDVFECGQRVVAMLEDTVRGVIRPVSALAKARMILPGRSETGEGPLRALHDEAARHRAVAGVLDISLFNVYPYGDGAEMGQAALVITDGDRAEAGRMASDLAHGFWDFRDSFVETLPSIDAALDMVRAEPPCRPFLLADMGDRVLAGAPGDSVEILRAAGRLGLRCLAPVTDACAVRCAAAAGQGARIKVELGGSDTPGLAPMTVEAEVQQLGPGGFVVAGPYKQGARIELGDTATLRLDDGSVAVATSRPGFIHDAAGFVAHGVDPADFDLVAIKSGHHFKLNFEGLGTVVSVASPGLSRYDPGAIPWSRSLLWPEHDVSEAPLAGPWISGDERSLA